MAEVILKKSAFTDNGDGTFTKTGSISPKTTGGAASKLDTGDVDVQYSSSNEAVATIEGQPDNKFKINWVGPGSVQVQVTGDADLDQGEVRAVGGFLDLKLEEDEADSIDMILD